MKMRNLSVEDYINRLPIGSGILCIASAVISFALAGSDTVALQWFSRYLQIFSAVMIGVAILGTFMAEVLRAALGNLHFPQPDIEIQYYLEKELHLLQQEFAKLSVQYETIAKDLEGLESQISDLDDTIAGLSF